MITANVMLANTHLRIIMSYLSENNTDYNVRKSPMMERHLTDLTDLADELQCLLKEYGRMTLASVARLLPTIPASEVYLAIGWALREGRLEVSNEKGVLHVAPKQGAEVQDDDDV